MLATSWKKILARAIKVTVHAELFHFTYVAAVHGGEYVRGLQEAKTKTGSAPAPVVPRRSAPVVPRRLEKKGGDGASKDDDVKQEEGQRQRQLLGGYLGTDEDEVVPPVGAERGVPRFGGKCRFKHCVQFKLRSRRRTATGAQCSIKDSGANGGPDGGQKVAGRDEEGVGLRRRPRPRSEPVPQKDDEEAGLCVRCEGVGHTWMTCKRISRRFAFSRRSWRGDRELPPDKLTKTRTTRSARGTPS